jgi:hypothetical protein
MTLSDYEYRNVIDYIKKHTTYNISDIIKKTDEQLYRMKQNIENAMATYPKEIFDYYQAHPEHTPRYSLEELKIMKYNQLSKLRQELKIRKGKKVTSTEPAPQTADKARQTIKQQTPNEVAKNVVLSNQIAENSHDYQFITREEAFAMYGEDITDEYLEEKGFKLYEPLKNQEYDPEQERYDLIDLIIDSEITIKGEPISIETLCLLSLDDLRKINEITQVLSKKQGNTSGLKI